MDSESSPSPSPSPSSRSRDSTKCCNCSCSCFTWHRSLKRKFDQAAVADGRDSSSSTDAVAYIEVENECAALREALASQQQAIQELCTELEEERNAAASAASEAMSMILRLQREKAETQMEARQFRRFVDEKMAHDQDELFAMEDLLYKREQLIQSLNCEIQAYKHRLMSFGYDEDEADDVGPTDVGLTDVGFTNVDDQTQNVGQTCEPEFEVPPMFDYPPLRCNLNEIPASPGADLDKYAFGETPRERLQNLGLRIHRLGRTPRQDQTDGGIFSARQSFVERTALPVSQSPRRPRHSRRFSTDSTGSFLGTVREMETPRTIRIGSMKNLDYASDFGDDMSDRIYTVDSVQRVNCNPGTKVGVGAWDEYVDTPRESWARMDAGEADIQKMYMRLQALEADRESMRQAIISMRTDKAQLVLLKEIAQHLYQEMSPEKIVCVKKPSVIGCFSVVSVLKWVVSFVLWKKKARRTKYSFGLSNNLGLLLLLDNSPHMRQWRCLTRASAT
ncbi:myosin-binding protein 7-like [Magnolia sinica]|uniref:myosin-binding protein 7-like n=1 Tax=Magnolia sinica TaxID=86752 RepID=UPI00265AA539|nr:myosin-binding protein 7-like [Magnolia sinica]